MKAEQIAFYVTLKPEEEVLEIVHASIVPRLPRLLLLVVLLLLPFFLMFPLFSLGLAGVAVFFALLFLGVLLSLRAYLRWNHTALVITDRRLVDIERRGLFDRVVTQAPFSQVDEVSYRIRGVWSTLFRYGSLRVQLAGSAADIEFHCAPAPARVHDLINDLRKVVADEVHEREEDRVRRLTRKLSPEDVDRLEQDVRGREIEEGFEGLYGPEASKG